MQGAGRGVGDVEKVPHLGGVAWVADSRMDGGPGVEQAFHDPACDIFCGAGDEDWSARVDGEAAEVDLGVHMDPFARAHAGGGRSRLVSGGPQWDVAEQGQGAGG